MARSGSPPESESTAATESEFDPESYDPETNTTKFHCRVCDYENTSRKSVVTHINRSDDAAHRDRSATEEPSLIEIEGNDLLKEWNAREDFEGTERVAYDDVDYKILFEIWRDPDATQDTIGERVGLTGVTVGNRIHDMGINWSERMEKVSDLFPVRAASAIGYGGQEDDVKGEETDEDEQVSLSFGNRSYHGPSKGINLAENGDGSSLGPTEKARRRLESFEELSSKQQAIIISGIVHGQDATDEKISETAGAPEIDRDSIPPMVSSVGKALSKHAKYERLTVGDLLERFKDDHDHELAELIDGTDVSTVPLHPYDPVSSDGSEGSDGPDGSDHDHGDQIFLELSSDEAFDLLTKSDAPEPVLRRIYKTVARSQG